MIVMALSQYGYSELPSKSINTHFLNSGLQVLNEQFTQVVQGLQFLCNGFLQTLQVLLGLFSAVHLLKEKHVKILSQIHDRFNNILCVVMISCQCFKTVRAWKK